MKLQQQKIEKEKKEADIFRQMDRNQSPFKGFKPSKY